MSGVPICERLRLSKSGFVLLEGDRKSLRNPDGPEAAELIEATIGLLSKLSRRAADVMTALEVHGGVLVPHLMDTDENVGQFLREAIEEARAALSRARNGGQP